MRAGIKAAGREVRLLPAYSPDLNPIELAFAKLKRILRSDGHRAAATLRTFLQSAATAFYAAECVRYIQHCGYSMPPATTNTH